MSISRADLQTLPHAIFLRRASYAPQGKGLQSRLGQGAFLALRLIDLLAPEAEPINPDAFRYQHAATARFCRDLRVTSTEGAHLEELVSSAGASQHEGDVRLLVPALFAYAHYLEDEMRLDEALDVLWTLRLVGKRGASVADAVALGLRIGRVNRKLARFDEAEEAYGEAGQVAASAGDAHSELLSRIGCAQCIRGRGNLPLAEESLRAILAAAARSGDHDVEARVEHEIGVALQHMGQPAEAIPHVWRAYELYDDQDSQLRALGDVGLMLLMLGDATGAERALSEVVLRGRTNDIRANAMIELMHCASFRRDRVGFARWRTRCEGQKGTMAPNILADYYLKAGVGEARFGQFGRAATFLEKALAVAEGAGIHEFVFKIERIKNGLHACEEAMRATSNADVEPVIQSEALREVSASLAHLARERA